MINLWLPFRKGLQDVLCIFYLPRAVLHQRGTQALENCFLKCRVDLLTAPNSWGKILWKIFFFFTLPAVLGSPGQAGRLSKLSLEVRSALRAGTSSPDIPALMLWTNSLQHSFYHAGPLRLMHKILNLQTKKNHILYTPNSLLPFLLCLFLLGLIKTTVLI